MMAAAPIHLAHNMTSLSLVSRCGSGYSSARFQSPRA